MTDPMETLAQRIRDTLNGRDMTAFQSLIAEDATWGEGGIDDQRACHSRNDIIATYKRLLDQGVHGTVIETISGPAGVACHLEIEWPDNTLHRREPTLYQVFLVRDGLITRVEGTDDRDLAMDKISR